MTRFFFLRLDKSPTHQPVLIPKWLNRPISNNSQSNKCDSYQNDIAYPIWPLENTSDICLVRFQHQKHLVRLRKRSCFGLQWNRLSNFWVEVRRSLCWLFVFHKKTNSSVQADGLHVLDTSISVSLLHMQTLYALLADLFLCCFWATACTTNTRGRHKQ